MATLTGVLLDVSGSMRINAGGTINEEGGEWVRSIFKVIESLIKHDVSTNNKVFSIGVGASGSINIFDVLKTIEEVQIKYKHFRQETKSTEKLISEERKYSNMFVQHEHGEKSPDDIFLKDHISLHRRKISSYDDVLEEFYELVETNGAQTIRKWASKPIIQQVVCYCLAVHLLSKLKEDREFLNIFIQTCLPRACRNIASETMFGNIANYLQGKATNAIVYVKTATEEDVSMVLQTAKKQFEYLLRRRANVCFDAACLKPVGSVFSVLEASDILHGCLDEDISAEDNTDEIMKAISPFIYGYTPLHEALNMTLPIFSDDKYSEYTKVLFVLSDGMPTDSGYDLHVSERLKRLNVIVVGCFINRYSNIKPRKLYSKIQKEWDKGATFLFNLSSTIPSQILPRTLFIKRGWDIDISNNETKLFLQINHPDNIHEACNLARNVVCCQDSLSDLLVSVSLDIYINQSTYGFKAQQQVGGTCYANASAAVLHLSMKRILGRDGGYPDFTDLRDKLVKMHGKDGANTFKVLEDITPEYRLHCKNVDANDAMKAIVAKRPVVATFRLTDLEWTQFSKFFSRDPSGILTKAEIDLDKRNPDDKLGGHAVVLTSFNSECFRFMNSWGEKWGDMGFFKVENSKVLDFEFIDVFWTLNDLSKQEVEYFKEHGAEVAQKIMKNLTGLQKATYKCPECAVISLVTEFSGSLKEAVCPKCEKKFCSNEAGNILALNMYLTSLSK